MNISMILKALQDHAKEEIRIHKEVFANTDHKDMKALIKKHLTDTKNIHKEFWTELKKAAKNNIVKNIPTRDIF